MCYVLDQIILHGWQIKILPRFKLQSLMGIVSQTWFQAQPMRPNVGTVMGHIWNK